MNLLQLFYKIEISGKKKYSVLFVSVILYIILTVLLGASPMPSFVLRGVMTQVQLLISVYIVLAMNKEGYITAVFLNSAGLLSAVLYMLKSNSPVSVPGMISYTAVIIILTLIRKYKEQLEISETKLHEQAYYDFLTKLPNRYLYTEKLYQGLEEARCSERFFGVAIMDLDSFKSINDMIGHLAGDEMLVEVSKRLAKISDRHCIVARPGGDEFLILVRDVPELSDIEKILTRIMGVFSEPFVLRGTEFTLSASAGAAVFPDDGDSAAELLKSADMAMYEAKKKGKNQYLFCNEEMRQDATSKTLLTNRLHKAMEKGELFLHYQPQIHAETGAVVGLEALLRWENADFGIIPPGTFIPLAEQAGLIRPIGLWVFRSVCEECRNCNIEYKDNIRVSINFSVEQLKDAFLVEHLSRIIQDTGVDPRKIQIEITESAAFSRDSAIIEKLMQLKELGLQIAIDDFGKDYSALSRIRSFPLDLLKIDMEFIHGLSCGNRKDRAIVKTIIQLAKNLGIKVLAEGVETEEQYQFLKQEKCDEIQGFYFYKGMPASEVKTLLESVGSAK